MGKTTNPNNHGNLDTSIAPPGGDIAVVLNASANSLSNNVRYTTSGAYTFTGVVSSTQYLKVTITNKKDTT